MTTLSWDEYFVNIARTVKAKSKDRSTQVGAVIVGIHKNILSTGFNGFPIGVREDEEWRHERPVKYQFTEHAERNAIYLAARHGTSLNGATLYLPIGGLPCTDCARACIQAGIRKIVTPTRKFDGKGKDWEEDAKISQLMLHEAGVEIVILDA